MNVNEIIAAEKTRVLEQIAFLSEEGRKLDQLYDIIEFLDTVESVDYSDSHYGYTETLRRVEDDILVDHRIVFELEYSDNEGEYDTTPMTIIEAAKWYQKSKSEYVHDNDNGDIDFCYSPRLKQETPAKNRRRSYRGRAKEEV